MNERIYINPIEHLMKLEMAGSARAVPVRRRDQPVEYDFSYHGVDMQEFPFNVWLKLYKDLLNGHDPDLLRAGDSQGHEDLRRSIAEYLHQSRGVRCTSDQIIISSGTEFLIQILVQLFDQNCIYGIENPGYDKLQALLVKNHAAICPIPIDKSGMMVDAIWQSRADILCVTPAHQFPSGEIMPIDRRIKLLNWANAAANRYIVEDDYDSEFKYGGKPIPALQGLDKNEKVAYMGTFSKSLSPALRVSYMVLPIHLLNRFRRQFSFLACPVPTLEQKVLTSFIRGGFFERHLNKMRTRYKRKREILAGQIQKYAGFMEVSGAEAGLHLLLYVKNGQTEDQLVAAALEHGVRVYGISKYYLEPLPQSLSPALVIGYATLSETEIVKAIERLRQAWFAGGDQGGSDVPDGR